ncbi:MAG: endonuclease V [Desulfurococcales archaeon]|nr:endonuclease V [Desulfurococcales archaeon]
MACTAGGRFNTARARAAQEILREMVILEDLYNGPRLVAGLDASYTRGSLGIGVSVLIDLDGMKTIDCVSYVREVCIPYIPGLLAYREMAVMAPALNTLIERGYRIDMVVVDGHGIAHPRGFGIASHVGVAFNIPSIGVAKKRLYGEVRRIGGREYIVDGERVLGGVVDRVYVSPGHMVSVDSAIRIIEGLRLYGRLPEPTRIADAVTKEVKRSGRLSPGFHECPAKARSASLLNYI